VPFISWATVHITKRHDLNSLITNQDIWSIAKISQSNLFLATKSNVWKYDGYSIKPLTINSNNKPLSIQNAKRLYVDSKSALWITTMGEGLIKYTNNHLSLFNTEESALESNIVTSIIEGNKNNMWIGTDVGLHKLSINQEIIYYPFTALHKPKDVKKFELMFDGLIF